MSSLNAPEGGIPHEQEIIAPPAVLRPENPTAAGLWQGNPALEMLFDLALRGELPRYRPLKPWEPQTLSPRHLDIVMAKACNVPQGMIAVLQDVTETTVSVVLNHPDAKYLLARIATFKADSMKDITKRLDALVPVAVDTLSDIMLDGKEENRMKVAFGILNRRGYNEKQETKHTHEFSVPAAQAARLTEALQEGRNLNNIEYGNYVVTAGGPSDGSDGGQAIQSDGSTPPAASPQTDSEVAA